MSQNGSPGNLMPTDYDSIVTGSMTPTNDALTIDVIEMPAAPRNGKVPCLLGFEIQFAQEETADDETRVSLCTKSPGTYPTLDDAEVICNLQRKLKTAVGELYEKMEWRPPALIPITASRLYVAVHADNNGGAELSYRVHLTWRYVSGLKQAQNTFVGQF